MRHDIPIEPTLQKLKSKQFEQGATITSDETGLDVAARGFWAAGQIAPFDIIIIISFLLKRYQIC